MYAISYGWCAVNHPDPDCFHLKRIAQCLEVFIQAKRNNDVSPTDMATFWDFLSCHQAPRSLLETELFKTALPGMQLVYGHDTFIVLKMKYMPAPPAPLGDDRCFAATVTATAIATTTIATTLAAALTTAALTTRGPIDP